MRKFLLAGVAAVLVSAPVIATAEEVIIKEQENKGKDSVIIQEREKTVGRKDRDEVIVKEREAPKKEDEKIIIKEK